MHLINRKLLVFIIGLILITTIAYYLSVSFNDNNNIKVPKETVQIQKNNDEKQDNLELFFSFLEYYELEEGDSFIGTLKKTNLNNKEIDQLIIAVKDVIEINLSLIHI